MDVASTVGKESALWALIQSRMEALNLNGSELARQIKVSRTQIENYKKGAVPHSSRLELLANALKVPLEQVVAAVPEATGFAQDAFQPPEAFMPRHVVYDSLAEFLEEFAGELDAHEVEHLSRIYFKGGDPGPAFWPKQLLRYRSEEARMAQGRDIAQDAPPLSSGRTLARASKPPKARDGKHSLKPPAGPRKSKRPTKG
jgi:transcriptional regulator with XRE-family HTH domain